MLDQSDAIDLSIVLVVTGGKPLRLIAFVERIEAEETPTGVRSIAVDLDQWVHSPALPTSSHKRLANAVPVIDRVRRGATSAE